MRIPRVKCICILALVLLGSSALEGQQNGAYLYWSEWPSIFRLDITTMVKDESFFVLGDGPLGIVVNDSHIYWTNFMGPNGEHRWGRSIGRANLDGTDWNNRFIDYCPASPYGIALDDTYLYWINTDLDNSIGRAKLDGTDVNQYLIDLPEWDPNTIDRALRGIAVLGGYIYWTDCGKDSIGRAKLDGSEVDENFIICQEYSQPHPIAVNDRYIFWAELGQADPADRVIRRSNLTGNGDFASFPIPNLYPVALAIWGDYIYWGNGPYISRVNLDLSTESFEPEWFAVTGGCVGLAFTPPRVALIFDGFFSPIENAPVVNQAKAGQAIPVKWRITDKNGLPISDPASFVSITSYGVSCSSFEGDPTSSVEEVAAGSSGLQYMGDGWWQYNWMTPKTYAGQCRIMKLTLDDKSEHTASFSFK